MAFKPIVQKQSAFSLIEVLVALLILSIGIVGAGKMLTQTVEHYHQAELRERVTILAWSIADYLRAYPMGQDLEKNTVAWQTQLVQTLPKGRLTIQRGQTAEKASAYTITISAPTVEKIQLELVN